MIALDKMQAAFEAAYPAASRARRGDDYGGEFGSMFVVWQAAVASCSPAAIAQASTPAAQWRIDGQPDPHAGHYDGERAALCLGKLTDDELANAAFMNYDVRPSIQGLIDGKAFSPIVYMTAVKERIRWLSRALVKATTPSVEQVDSLTDERAAFEDTMNNARFFPAELNFKRTKSPSGRDEYENSHLQSNWEGWQARAAIAATRQAGPVPNWANELRNDPPTMKQTGPDTFMYATPIPTMTECMNAAAPVQAAPEVKTFADGVATAANWVERRRENFDSEHGIVDCSTGTLEYGTGPHAQAMREYSFELFEIAEGIRALAAAPAPGGAK